MKLLLVLASLGVMVCAAPQYPDSGSSGGYDSLRNIDLQTLLAAVRSRTQQGYSAPAQDTSSQYAAPAPAAQDSAAYSAPAPAAAAAAPQYNAPSGPSAPEAAPSAPASQPSNNYGAPSPAYGEQEQEVHKHVYVHVAPQETPTQKPIKPYKPPQKPEKHYKILFIKAPTPGPYEAPDIPELKPEAEQKTLVYVLLKKAEPTPELVLPTHAPTKPSKPEVYFIRYKTPEDPDNKYGAPAPGPEKSGY